MTSFSEFANSFQEKSRLRLEGISKLCEKTGNPQKGLNFIHIAGTNGKGSVCAFLQKIITLSGKKCGKFISPNMLDVCERISIDGKNISKEDMDRLLSVMEKCVSEIKEETGDCPTQFEIWTAAAFLYFKEQGCDVVVLETGLGGRLDATNVIEKNLCAVITPIGIDHTSYLGNTIEEIAAEKAGIIKEGCPVITAPQKEGAMRVLSLAAKEKNSPFFKALPVLKSRNDGFCEIFDTEGASNIRLGLLGGYQAQNGALAVTVARFLGIDDRFIRQGFLQAKNPGRFEILCKNPVIVFDGAHNESGMQALVSSINRYFCGKRLSVIYGAMADKDFSAVLKVLTDAALSDKIKVYTVTVENNPRAQSALNLCCGFKKAGFNAEECKNVREAILKAKKAGDTTVICGSLYLYKDVYENAKDIIKIENLEKS